MESQKVEREKCQDEAYKFLPLFIRQKDVVTYVNVLEGKDLLVPFLNPTTFLKIL